MYQNNTRMAQKLIARINQKAHLVRCTEKPEVAEMIRILIRCMDEKQEFYLEETKADGERSKFWKAPARGRL